MQDLLQGTAATPRPQNDTQSSELLTLRNAAAVRERCKCIYDWVADRHSPYFALDTGRLDDVARYVADVTREAYPDLLIPYHSRWRHFCADGVDRWQGITERVAAEGPIELARTAVDLAVVSVLLDAGAGDAWRYRDPESNRIQARSEGLAIASIDMFKAGCFSSDPAWPWRVDHVALKQFNAVTLGRGLQVAADNPLVGLDQRTALLQRLGRALASQPALFGTSLARPGHLVDHFIRCSPQGRVTASDLLTTLLDAFPAIWPSGLIVEGFPIGDAGRHPAVCTGDQSDGIVPFHKLSQWLVYSLIEPLEMAGLQVDGVEQLTALAEYRNGGLLVDFGVIRARQQLDPRTRWEVGSQFVVEWRALTVALMDQLLTNVRDILKVGASFQMPQLLQGGTWSAGRKIALTLRPPLGPSPISIAADGSVL
ncbi:MAG: DUF1688 family protein [Rhizobiales bacterium]|nr:DUF1688 family protein [Hyphomicrobiales bacterium]